MQQQWTRKEGDGLRDKYNFNYVGIAPFNNYMTFVVCSGKKTVGSLPNNLPTHLAPKPNRSRYKLF